MRLVKVCQVCEVAWDEQAQLALNCPVCGATNPTFFVHDDFCPRMQSDEAICLCELLKGVRDDERRVASDKIRGIRRQLADVFERYPESRDHERAQGHIRGLYEAEKVLKGHWLRRRTR
jgi:hypothetical protein